MRISDWSSDVCSSDLPKECRKAGSQEGRPQEGGCEDHCLQASKSCAEAGRSRHPRNEDHERHSQEVRRRREDQPRSHDRRLTRTERRRDEQDQEADRTKYKTDKDKKTRINKVR